MKFYENIYHHYPKNHILWKSSNYGNYKWGYLDLSELNILLLFLNQKI